jgi:cytochrome oxidase Cu insertion factor (SCO1/SenC/PrrC family)
MTEVSASARNPRRALLGLAAIFLVPVAISFWLYYGADYRPGGQVNRGELIEPARALPPVSLATPEGTATAETFLRDKWTLLYVGEGACDERCRQALYHTRQVRLALAEKMDRVQRVFLYQGTCCEQPWFGTEQAGLIAASLDSGPGRELLGAFPQPDAVLAGGRIYVVDPLGNLMMSYAPDAPPKGMIEDLKRLLKLSHIG